MSFIWCEYLVRRSCFVWWISWLGMNIGLYFFLWFPYCKSPFGSFLFMFFGRVFLLSAAGTAWTGRKSSCQSEVFEYSACCQPDGLVNRNVWKRITVFGRVSKSKASIRKLDQFSSRDLNASSSFAKTQDSDFIHLTLNGLLILLMEVSVSAELKGYSVSEYSRRTNFAGDAPEARSADRRPGTIIKFNNEKRCLEAGHSNKSGYRCLPVREQWSFTVSVSLVCRHVPAWTIWLFDKIIFFAWANILTFLVIIKIQKCPRRILMEKSTSCTSGSSAVCSGSRWLAVMRTSVFGHWRRVPRCS